MITISAQIAIGLRLVIVSKYWRPAVMMWAGKSPRPLAGRPLFSSRILRPTDTRARPFYNDICGNSVVFTRQRWNTIKRFKSQQNGLFSIQYVDHALPSAICQSGFLLHNAENVHAFPGSRLCLRGMFFTKTNSIVGRENLGYRSSLRVT